MYAYLLLFLQIKSEFRQDMNNYLLLIITIILNFIGSTCSSNHHKDDPYNEDPRQTDFSRTVLIYAVASNNLSPYLEKDKDEMIQAATSIEGLGKNFNVLLYSVASKNATEATLAELNHNSSGQWEFQTIKSYDRNTFSTDPKRMSEVFSDVRDMSQSDNYGLVFWSHGTGWIPDFLTHEIPGKQRSFGWDTYNEVTDKCDITELATAIPDRMFDYIWFDVCYMMGIETSYQLRNKTDYICGYPTEDWSPGMNYETTLPMLTQKKPDLTGAAKAFFDYYNNSNMAVTVTVLQTKGLDRLASAAADLYANGKRPADAFGMQDYGRLPYRGLYDFGQFTRAYANDDKTGLADKLSEFDKALDGVLLYGGCSTKNFDNIANAFNPNIYSGMSCHFPDTSTAENEEFYRNLDWVRDTNP